MTDIDPSAPLLFRLALAFGRPFGVYYVPENHFQFVKRMERYHRVEHAGFHHHNRLIESLGPLIKAGPEVFSYTFNGLPAQDGLQVGLRLALLYNFEPEKTKLTTAARLAALPREVFYEIVANRARRALVSIVSAYTAEQVCRGQEFENIEKQVVVDANQRLAPLGISISGPMVLQVMPPDSLRARFEGVAQRRVQVEAMREFHSTEMSRALAAELIEGVSARGSGEQYVNPSASSGQAVSDALNTYNQPDSNASPTLPADPERKSFLKSPKK